MADADLNRCLTMASYSAFVVLRQHLSKNPGLDLASAISVVKKINSDAAGLDFVGGAAIHELIDQNLEFQETYGGLRLIALQLVTISRPWWLRLVPYGRDKVRSVLDQDQFQWFREAGLFDPIPDAEAIAWWDGIGEIVRGAVGTERLVRARAAERLSLDYERNRLKGLGITLEPQWVALEDNTLGYDIRSYDLWNEEIIARLIEVKSTTSDTIFITKNEWRNAASADPHYRFHVWKLPEKVLTEYSVGVMAAHIPIDRGSGTWENVRIDLSTCGDRPLRCSMP